MGPDVIAAHLPTWVLMLIWATYPSGSRSYYDPPPHVSPDDITALVGGKETHGLQSVLSHHTGATIPCMSNYCPCHNRYVPVSHERLSHDTDATPPSMYVL